MYFRKSTGSLGWLQNTHYSTETPGQRFCSETEITVREGRQTEQAYEREKTGKKEELRTWKQKPSWKRRKHYTWGRKLQACQAWSREQSWLRAAAAPSSELLHQNRNCTGIKTHCIVTLNGWFYGMWNIISIKTFLKHYRRGSKSNLFSFAKYKNTFAL